MAGFDLAAILADSVSNLDTAMETIEYIPREKIRADPGNFYSMEGIEELAANIELCGLMDPIRVRAEGEGYKIVSGHRRFAAMTMLAQDGNETYFKIPAIIDISSGSPAMQELRLIFANSDTRKMSSADMLKQTERVTELLYQLQEEGVEFPGRMRDHVAEACKVSTSKIARLNAIKNGLSLEARVLYDKNEINESVAYKLAGLPKSHQNLILGVLRQNGKKVTQSDIEYLADWLTSVIALKCKKGDGCCENLEGKLTAWATTEYFWNLGCRYYCCKQCSKFARCKHSCAKCSAEKAKAKEKADAETAEVRAANKAAKQKQEEAARTTVQRLTALYLNAGKLMKAAGVKAKDISNEVTLRYNSWQVEKYFNGDLSGLVSTGSVFGSGLSVETLDRLIAAADMLGVSLDQLLIHTPVNAEAPAQLPAAKMSWQTGTPEENGQYALEISEESHSYFDVAYYISGKFWFDKCCDFEIKESVVRWVKLPKEEEL